jgi:hypothetical protein
MTECVISSGMTLAFLRDKYIRFFLDIHRKVSHPPLAQATYTTYLTAYFEPIRDWSDPPNVIAVCQRRF